jgi:RAB protein geranylgeranyltransferase component A
MDRNDYYGGECASLNLTQVGHKQFVALVNDAHETNDFYFAKLINETSYANLPKCILFHRYLENFGKGSMHLKP